MPLLILTVASAGAFYYYGFETLYGAGPRAEYVRYGIPRLRVPVGCLQLVGATGLLVGLLYEPAGIVGAAGLALMMLIGLVMRARIGDSLRMMLPRVVSISTRASGTSRCRFARRLSL